MGILKTDWFSAEFTRHTKKHAKHLWILATDLHFIIASFQFSYFFFFLEAK